MAMRVIQVDLTKDFSEAIREAVKILQYGGTVVYPTDTLYGLGANALNEIAVRKIFAIKQRPDTKPLPILARNMMWAKELAQISQRNEAALKKLWPGAVTVILPSQPIVPDAVTRGNKSIAVRIADHPLVDQLLGAFGYPLTATSANISGDEPRLKAEEIAEIFSKCTYKPDLILDVGTLPPSSPSTVLDLTGREPKILRVGAAKPNELLSLLNGI